MFRFALPACKYFFIPLIAGVLSFRSNDCNDIPALNKKIVELVKRTEGTRVDRGECWDLAAFALDKAGADWDHSYGFGKEVAPGKDCIYPGDIIQFRHVKTKIKKGNLILEQAMEKHTAIIIKVNGSTYDVAEQNTSDGGKKVRVATFDPATVIRGTVTYYQPVPKTNH